MSISDNPIFFTSCSFFSFLSFFLHIPLSFVFSCFAFLLHSKWYTEIRYVLSFQRFMGICASCRQPWQWGDLNPCRITMSKSALQYLPVLTASGPHLFEGHSSSFNICHGPFLLVGLIVKDYLNRLQRIRNFS